MENNDIFSEYWFKSDRFNIDLNAALEQLRLIPFNVKKILEAIHEAILTANHRHEFIDLIKQGHLTKWLDIERNQHEYFGGRVFDDLAKMRKDILIYRDRLKEANKHTSS